MSNFKVKIYGAGSIGNHLAQASRRAGWQVAIIDSDSEALERTKKDIYPSRYGKWDGNIQLYILGEEPKGGFDVIFLGTPPHVRMSLAKEVLLEKPKVLQLEKPISPPFMKELNDFCDELKNYDTKVVVGYDHVLGRAVKKAEEVIAEKNMGEPIALDVEFRETWKGIFGAHPWLGGPQDTYLGFWKKGGGASGEHSHAINLWQHFARVLGLGKVREVSAAMQMVKDDIIDYDQSCFLHLTTDKGFIGRVAQDVITNPVKKQIRIQFESGFIEVNIGAWEGGDIVRVSKNGEAVEEIKISKTRPDDFYEEILHIKDILDGRIDIKDSPISLNRGFDTMNVVSAAHISRQQKKTVLI